MAIRWRHWLLDIYYNIRNGVRIHYRDFSFCISWKPGSFVRTLSVWVLVNKECYSEMMKVDRIIISSNRLSWKMSNFYTISMFWRRIFFLNKEVFILKRKKIILTKVLSWNVSGKEISLNLWWKKFYRLKWYTRRFIGEKSCLNKWRISCLSCLEHEYDQYLDFMFYLDSFLHSILKKFLELE